MRKFWLFSQQSFIFSLFSQLPFSLYLNDTNDTLCYRTLKFVFFSFLLLMAFAAIYSFVNKFILLSYFSHLHTIMLLLVYEKLYKYSKKSMPLIKPDRLNAL